MMRKSLSIIGYYTSNFGDLLMLKGLINALPKNYQHLYILTYGQMSLKDIGEIGLNGNYTTIINLTSKISILVSLIKAIFQASA